MSDKQSEPVSQIQIANIKLETAFAHAEQAQASRANALEIDSGDVIRLILQFCKERGLSRTVETLQEESQVSLNSIESTEAFISDVHNGNWDNVLQTVSLLKIPMDKLMDLYEQIILELIELREIDTARSLLRQTKPMATLKQGQPERYMRLERWLTRNTFDAHEAYPGGSTKEKRRAAIAQSLMKEVVVTPPSRLMALITQALKWQQFQGILPPGTKFDLFRNTAPQRATENESPPGGLDKIIKFGTKSFPEVARFTPDGQHLVSGSSDGFIEIWNFLTGKLNKDLKYQADDEIMMHEDSVLCLNFSSDSELIASGSKDGKIKVWQIRTGKCIRKFDGAHTQGVTCLTFAKDGSQILSGSFDQTARVHGLKSGKTLKLLRGHSSFVNECAYSSEGTRAITCSSDGTVKVWDLKTSECSTSFSPMIGQTAMKESSIYCIALNPKNTEQVFLGNRSPYIFLMNLKGQMVKTYSSEKQSAQGGDFHCFCVSPRGDYLYAVAEDSIMYCFNLTSGKVEHMVPKLHDKETLGLAHHPYMNLIATFSGEGTLKLWR